jgi:hypothetical protein
MELNLVKEGIYGVFFLKEEISYRIKKRLNSHRVAM